MPQLGSIKRPQEVGYRADGASLIWHACVDCGKERWVQVVGEKPRSLRCYSCAKKGKCTGENHPRWNGGQIIKHGYVLILNPQHPKASNRGYVKRARLVLEAKLGRYLLP